MEEKILILDFGSQYTQLIARRVRELFVYSEIIPCTASLAEIKRHKPRGIILSGGPQSVYEEGALTVDPKLFSLGVPVLGICYGLQLMNHLLGGQTAPAPKREYGRAPIKNLGGTLLKDLPATFNVWMSHGDEVATPPPGFTVTAVSKNSVAAMENEARRLYGIQFHPEVAHTAHGTDMLSAFLTVCGVSRTWDIGSYATQAVEAIRRQVGNGKVICALSGGVDSSVAATLVARAVGDRQTCIFVNTGLLRMNEYEDILRTYEALDLRVVAVDARRGFLKKLSGVTDPETKRKIIGAEFIRVFDREARKIGGVTHLVQGTLYPDVIESIPVNGQSAVIKSHHNVGGLPEKMHLKLVEPLRELFKDEVRALGRELGVPENIIGKQPFPGPGLAVRILGEITPERLGVLGRADVIVREEIERGDHHKSLWQWFAILLPISSVGVMGDQRTYEHTIALRAVESSDGMTGDWSKLPYAVLEAISSRIISEVRGINRVVYDISSKPPATIEWE